MASPTRFASGTKTTNWRHTQSWSTQSYAMHTRSVLVRDGLTLRLSQLTQAGTVHKTVEVLRKATKAEAMQGALRGDARAAKRRAEELQNEIEKMCVRGAGWWLAGLGLLLTRCLGVARYNTLVLHASAVDAFRAAVAKTSGDTAAVGLEPRAVGCMHDYSPHTPAILLCRWHTCNRTS